MSRRGGSVAREKLERKDMRTVHVGMRPDAALEHALSCGSRRGTRIEKTCSPLRCEHATRWEWSVVVYACGVYHGTRQTSVILPRCAWLFCEEEETFVLRMKGEGWLAG